MNTISKKEIEEILSPYTYERFLALTDNDNCCFCNLYLDSGEFRINGGRWTALQCKCGNYGYVWISQIKYKFLTTWYYHLNNECKYTIHEYRQIIWEFLMMSRKYDELKRKGYRDPEMICIDWNKEEIEWKRRNSRRRFK